MNNKGFKNLNWPIA